MGKLKDYSGDFKPDLKLEDLSKDFLITLIKQYAAAYTRLAEFWYVQAARKVGEKEALIMEKAVWDEVGATTVPKIAKAANIQVKDLVDAIKVWQTCPDGTMQGVYEGAFDIKNRNHVILTFTRCRTLDFFERKSPERIKSVCHELEKAGMEAYFRTIIPGVEVTALKLPPRKSPDEIACQWEYKLRKKA